MKNSILVLAFVFAGSVAFAGNSTVAGITVDKAISCFVKALKPEAFNAAWTNGGKKEFMKKVKHNENYPVLGDQLGNLVSIYLSDAAFKDVSERPELSREAAAANQAKTVAAALWNIQQRISPSVISEKGQKMMDKYSSDLKALAS